MGRAIEARGVSVWEDLAVEVHDGNGPYALFVHGFLSSRSHWLPNVGPLGEVCRPVVVEQYGHGRASTPSDPERWSASAYGDAFEAIRRELGGEPWYVVGHSLGGALTIRYAIERPESVLAHVFTNSQSAFADQTWTDQVVANSAKLAARLEGPDGRTELDNHPMHPRGAGRVPPDVSAALVEDFGHHDPVGVAMQMRYTLPTASVRSLAPENKCPALLTIGSSETAFVETAEHVREVMPHLESVELDAGHNVNLHAIDAWNEAVARFFASHHPSS